METPAPVERFGEKLLRNYNIDSISWCQNQEEYLAMLSGLLPQGGSCLNKILSRLQKHFWVCPLTCGYFSGGLAQFVNLPLTAVIPALNQWSVSHCGGRLHNR
jgi:hypothetical protein